MGKRFVKPRKFQGSSFAKSITVSTNTISGTTTLKLWGYNCNEFTYDLLGLNDTSYN